MSKHSTGHITGSYKKGDRVSRKDSAEQGTVIQSNGDTKVKWDGGRTSYFKTDKPANMKHRLK